VRQIRGKGTEQGRRVDERKRVACKYVGSWLLRHCLEFLVSDGWVRCI
jgi:hypothetical protein